jgi:hypothetical protein
MELRRVAVSPHVTRYFVSARLGPRSRLHLITTDGTIVASWKTWAESEHVHGEWVSPHPDLAAVVDGLDIDANHDAAAFADLTSVRDMSPNAAVGRPS